MKRLESLDALRGFDMFFIMGGAGLIAAIASLFPESGCWQTIAEQMDHVSWEGLRHHDTIFPLFLFIAGVSFPFSLAKQEESGKSMCAIYAKIVRRGIILVLLGMIYNGMLDMEFSTLRFPSVLARIGLGWMFAALLYTWCRNWKVLLGTVIFILIGYWLVLLFVESPIANGADPFSREGCIVCYWDSHMLGAHSYQPDYDPEGFVSTFPGIATALLGVLAGIWLKQPEVDGKKKTLVLVACGVICALLGWAWSYSFPIVKALWSSSFVLAVGGYSFLMLALFYYLIDVRGWRSWDKFFVVIGMNSITIYLAQRFIPFGSIAGRIFGGFSKLFGEQWENILIKLAYIVVCWLFLYFLYKKKTFLKI